MDWSLLWTKIVVLGIFSVFITSIIEVIKGISAIGLKGLLIGLYTTLIKNKPMPDGSFQVLNFLIALLCCWAFNIGLMSTFTYVLGIATRTTLPGVSSYIDYFGTASVVYLGADQMFKKFIDVAKVEAKDLKDLKESMPKISSNVTNITNE
jgi:hypothetical protein